MCIVKKKLPFFPRCNGFSDESCDGNGFCAALSFKKKKKSLVYYIGESHGRKETLQAITTTASYTLSIMLFFFAGLPEPCRRKRSPHPLGVML
jgi:hypothetical protein